MTDSGSAWTLQHKAGSHAQSETQGTPERRQLTVMFCDLVGSTALSRVLDPEDLRDVLRAYQELATEVIEAYGGSITRYMGDGILVLFGYPMSHEDSSARAVHAAVEIVEAIETLDRSQRFGPQVSLKVRLGLATGLTVVGDVIGTGPAREEAVVGETPNLAARLQGLAAPNEIMISGATRALVGERFECEALGERALKGFADPVEVWRVRGARNPLSLMDAVDDVDEPPMVNRERERSLLARLWQRSCEGQGQLVAISGEPGIGKTRLTRMLRGLVGARGGAWLRLQCLSYFANSALHPVANRIALLAQLAPGDEDHVKFQKLDAAFGALLTRHRQRDLALLADLLGLPATGRGGATEDLQLSPQRRKQLLLDALVELLLAMSRQHPVALVVEDAHWMDPTTGELLHQISQGIGGARVLVAITYRAGVNPGAFQAGNLTHLELARLHPLENQAIVEGVLGQRVLPPEVVQSIVRRTDGVPLFVEELTRAIVDGGGTMAGDSVPISLKDSLMARIDQLGEAKPLAQLAAVLGQQFSYALLREVAARPDARLDEELARLVDANILVQSARLGGAADYSFRHALVRDAAYESQLRRRREAIHARAGDALESRFEDVVQRNPELVAQHFSAARRYPQAAQRWIDAGRRASERSANKEAVSHLEQGRAALAAMPDSARRDQMELELLNLLGPALFATVGPGLPVVTETYNRALEVCERLPESAQHFEALWGWWRVSINHDIGKNRADRLLVLADRLDDPALELQAHHCQWATLFHLGEHVRSLAHVSTGLGLYDADAHRHQAAVYGGHDARVCGEGERALSLWLQGHPGQAQTPLDRALAWAVELKHVGSIAHARDYAVLLSLYRRDGDEVRRLAAELGEFAKEQGLPDYALRARFFDAWAMANAGDREQGLEGMRQAVDALKRIGTREDFPMFYELMVQVMGQLGQHREALALLLESFRESKATGMRFWLAEQHRCRGELIVMTSGEGAEAALRQAISVATHQGAQTFALRAATSLARVLEHEGRGEEGARHLARHLAPFAPGDPGRDLSEARDVLAALSAT